MTSGAIIQAMAQVIAFRPWLYDTSVAGPLDRLVAPPYDVISPDLQTELYQRSPYNVVRVDLNREPGDRRYQEAARALAASGAAVVLAARAVDPSEALAKAAIREAGYNVAEQL